MQLIENKFYDIVTYLKTKPTKPKAKKNWTRVQYRSGKLWDCDGDARNPDMNDVREIIIPPFEGELVPHTELEIGVEYQIQLVEPSYQVWQDGAMRGVGLYIGNGRFRYHHRVDEVQPGMYHPHKTILAPIPERFEHIRWVSVLHLPRCELENLRCDYDGMDESHAPEVVFEVVDGVNVLLGSFVQDGVMGFGITHVGFFYESSERIIREKYGIR